MDFNVPKGFLNVAVLSYNDDSYSRSGATNYKATYQITPAWRIPFQLGTLKMEFAGFTDFIGPRGGGKVSHINSQVQLRYDIGHVVGRNGRVFVGVEYHYFHNKGGTDGLNEHVPQALMAVVF